MKKNFTNPEIKITLFNQERVHTTGDITVGTPSPDVIDPSGVPTNYNRAIDWINTRNISTQNIFSYKQGN